MDIIEKITDGSSVVIGDKTYKVLGKAWYATQEDTKTKYVKVLLENHYVLVLMPSDNIAYLGHNEGKIAAFDGFGEAIKFSGREHKRVAHGYQIVLEIEFGSPLEVEGECEFWDYEAEDSLVGIAVLSRNKKRADILANYVDFSDIKVLETPNMLQ